MAIEQLQTESLRLTAFLPLQASASEPTWWKDLLGTEPETRVLKPAMGILQESGPVDNGALILNVQQNRIDWFLTPNREAGILPTTRGTGTADEMLKIFGDLMIRWLVACPPLNRLALGAIMHEPMPDAESAYRRLASYLPSVTIDPINSSDFGYQINRPRQSAVIDSLKINRLSKWSTALYVGIPFQISPPGSIVVPTVPGVGQYSCRIETDISTDQKFQGDLPHDRMSRLFDELKELTIEIITRGDLA